MAAKGVAAPEVVLQAVLMSFEAQDISPAKLIDAARHYKDIITQKNDDFLKGAASEKNNQLQKGKMSFDPIMILLKVATANSPGGVAEATA